MPFMTVDPFMIPSPDPTRHYRWLSDNPRRLSMWLRSYGTVSGYALEPAANCEKLGLPESYGQKATGRIVMGDNILASVPLEEFHQRQRDNIDAQLERLAAVKEEFHAQGEMLPGIRTFEEDPEQTADRKRYHTRPDRPFSGQAGRGNSPVFKTS